MEDHPVFTALSTSARQLYLLLRCIAFASRAEVQITSNGIRFSVEQSRVVQGLAFLDKGLFSSYNLNVFEEEQSSVPPFQISLSALLETLQIFGISDTSSNHRSHGGGFSSSYHTAFNTPALGLGSTCRISYAQVGAPLTITIQEGSVTTTCEMNTYEVQSQYDDDGGIPLDRNAMCLKIIMRSTWLHDAVAELAGTNPTVLVLNASNQSAPYLSLEGQGGPFGDSTVDFMPESKTEPTPSLARGKRQPLVTETFSVAAPSGSRGRVKQKYQFDLIKKAGRAMALASKVSIRQDVQGVLSLQFMIEINESGVGTTGAVGGGVASAAPDLSSGRVSFVDFRFVPLLDDDDEGEDENETEEEGSAV